MGFALEVMIVPVLLLTVIAVVLIATEASFGVAFVVYVVLMAIKNGRISIAPEHPR